MSDLVLSNDLNIITAEINSYKQMAGQAIFEIGKRLKHVKEKDLSHGEWMKWCERMVGFTTDQANKYIKVFDRFSNSDSNLNLSVSALYLLTSLTDEQINQTHSIPSTGEQKTVDEMTVKELREVKKALQDERERFREFQGIAADIEQRAKQLEQQLKQEKSKPVQVVEKEVVPTHISKKLEEDQRTITSLRRGYQELKQQLETAELQSTNKFDPTVNELRKKKLQQEADINSLELRVHVKNFLEKVAITSLLKGSLAAADLKTKKLLAESVGMLEEFTDEIKSALKSEMIFEEAQYQEVL